MSGQAAAPPQLRRRIVPITALLVVYFLIASNWLHPFLRFTSQTVNSLVIIAGFCLPWAALALVWRLPVKILTRLNVTVILLPFMLYTTFFGFAISKTLIGEDPAALGKVAMDGYRVNLYRIMRGQNSGIAVQQERDLLPGVMLVKRLPGFYPAATAQYQVTGSNELRVSVPAYAPDHPETAKTQTYTLKRFIYF